MSFIIIPQSPTLIGSDDLVTGNSGAVINSGNASALAGGAFNGTGGFNQAGNNAGAVAFANGGTAVAGGVAGIQGGSALTVGNGGDAEILGGDAAAGVGSGGNAIAQAGNCQVGGTPGNVLLAPGVDNVSVTGRIILQTNGGVIPLGAAPNGQAFTTALTGPGGAPVAITAWVPVTLDGVAGWMPFVS